MNEPGQRANGSGASLERLLALALCLPTALLLVPGALGPLTGDPDPELAGAAWALAASLPAALLVVWRPPARSAFVLAPWLVVCALALVRSRTLDELDPLAAQRVLMGFASGSVLLCGGFALGACGRRVLALGLAALTLLASGGALLDAHGVGPLGNAGELAETAVLGAAAGVVLATGRGVRAWQRALGGAAALSFALFALQAPSLLGVLALAGASGAAALLARDVRAIGRAGRLGFAAALVALLPLCVRSAGEVPPAATTPAAAAARVDPGDTGGIEVRRRVWAATLDMIAAHALVGVGPGQFARAFPAWRDPREIELSTLERRLAAETEVEHPHDDPLLAAAELGVPGGLAFVLFLGLVLAAALRGLRTLPGDEGDDTPPANATAALGAAALAASAGILGGGALLDDPAAASAALAAFGALLGGRRAAAARAGLGQRLVPLCAAAFVAAQLGAAADVARHGRALRAASAALSAQDGARLERALDDALRARPDSALALSLRARSLEARLPAGDERVLDAWRAVLALRPLRIEALLQLGLQHARRGELHDARRTWQRALELDPGHPGLLWNLARIELLAGRAAPAFELLDELERRGRLQRTALERLAIELLLRGRDREGLPLAARAGLVPADADAAQLQQRSERARTDGDDALADALVTQARRGFAREHAAAGRWHDALRLYRIALAPTTALDPDGALPIRLELAAAALAEGDEALARERVGGTRPSAADWAGLPAWAGERLRATGWFDDG